MSSVKYKFNVRLLEEANEFLDAQDEKSREKMLYNIWKSRIVNDKELLKKLEGEIWEFRTLHNKTYFRLLAFWDKTEKENTLVVATHGVVKKTDKMPKGEIQRAELLRVKYFKEKE